MNNLLTGATHLPWQTEIELPALLPVRYRDGLTCYGKDSAYGQTD